MEDFCEYLQQRTKQYFTNKIIINILEKQLKLIKINDNKYKIKAQLIEKQKANNKLFFKIFYIIKKYQIQNSISYYEMEIFLRNQKLDIYFIALQNYKLEYYPKVLLINSNIKYFLKKFNIESSFINLQNLQKIKFTPKLKNQSNIFDSKIKEIHQISEVLEDISQDNYKGQFSPTLTV